MDQAIAVLSYIGFMFLAVCAVTGAFIWLRWGMVGVTVIWSLRKVMDVTVWEDFDSAAKHAMDAESRLVETLDSRIQDEKEN
jgi:hypothetical protein